MSHLHENLKKYQSTLQNLQTAHHRCVVILINKINGELSQHSKSNSDVQLKNTLNIAISKKARKLNLEKQLIDIQNIYHQNYVKLNSDACEATATNHKNNLQTSAKDNQINQIKTNSEKINNKSNLSKKSNQSIKTHT